LLPQIVLPLHTYLPRKDVSSLALLFTGHTSYWQEALPGVPPVGDFVPGYEVSTWVGIGAPKGTPSEVIDMLNREINAGLDSPRIKARYAELGATPFAGSPADFGKFMTEDTEKWAKVIKFANIRAE
jgi:tripartite-type tricarboxylate transporter receptor subunit TctC